MEVDKVMQIIKSVRTQQWNVRRGLISARIAAAFSSANNSSKSKRIAFWSATTLAFLIAPLAALVWSGGTPTANGVNLNVAAPGTGIDAESQGSSVNVLSGAATEAAGNSSSASVSNESGNSVVVNGQAVPTPESGSSNQTIVGNDGQVTHVNISSSNTSNGDTERTHSNLNVKTHTDSQTKTKSSQ
jgi:hypothetical protein